jgi:hypothetical protein
MTHTLDKQDEAEKLSRFAQYDSLAGPRVGDFVLMLDGSTRRFTHDWGDGLQTTVNTAPCNGDQSFYHGGTHVSFSGSLAPSIPLEQIKPTSEILHGWFWFFHHDQQRAHNGVHFKLPCRVFTQKEVTQ